MTKLQVVTINDKEVGNLLALLVDHDVAHGDIELGRILAATTNDSGLEHTIHRGLRTVFEPAPGLGLAADELTTTRIGLAR